MSIEDSRASFSPRTGAAAARSLLRLGTGTHRVVDSPRWRILVRATASGAVDWHCEAPLARVCITTGGNVIEGEGYVERLQLGIAPWALPVARILWGRWTRPARSVVWIAWEGSHALRLVWVDGVLVADAAPSTACVDRHEETYSQKCEQGALCLLHIS